MPSSEEVIEARNKIKEWYLEQLMKDHSHLAAYEIYARTSYEEMRVAYCKMTGAYSGPYSAL